MAFTDRLNLLVGGVARRTALPLGSSEELGERLIACLPSAVRDALARRHRRMIFELDGEIARVELVVGQKREHLGDVSLDGPLTLPSSFYEMAKDQSSKIELLLPKGAILQRSVSFPSLVKANLTQVIGYELDRLSPFQAKDVMFDFESRGNVKGADKIYLDLAICRRDMVEPWVKRFGELGAAIDRVRWGDAWPRANLLPPDQRPRRRRFHLSLTMILWISILLLTLAAMGTPIWQKTRILEGLESQLKSARTQAIAVDELRQELERAREGSTAVLQRKIDQPPILELLRELTDRLPDDTWIQNLELRDGLVDLRGESQQATALIALLEQTPGIDGVSFKSPVTQIARTGKERFYISFSFTRSVDQE